MSELDAFEAKVSENIKLLSSTDAKVRRKAAEWLGEAGDPRAITRLRQVYKEDRDKKVRQAAAYSLGMFRALEHGLAGSKRETVVKLLEDIALRGKMGRRSSLRKSTLAKINVGLLIAAILLLLFNFVLWPTLKPILNQTPGTASVATNDNEAEDVPAKDRDTLLSELNSQLTLVRNDVERLQSQFQTVLGGSTVNCGVFFNNPAEYNAASAQNEPDIAAIIADLNAARSSLATAKESYDQACPPNSTPLTAAEVGAPMSHVVQALTSLASVEEALAAVTSGAVESTESVTQEAVTQVAATPTPEINVRLHLTSLGAIVDNVQAARGANTILNQYWSDVRSSGTRAGCDQPVPNIPPDYVLPEADGAALPNLKLATDLVNGGLSFLRQGWTQYTNACNANNLPNALTAGSQMAQNATSAFENAQTMLTTVRNSLN
jgi:hypothetical protein